MILDHTLVASGDKDEVFDTGSLGLVDHMLNDGLVDDRQHFLRQGFCGGKEAGAKSRDRQDGFANGLLLCGHRKFRSLWQGGVNARPTVAWFLILTERLICKRVFSGRL